MTSVVSRVLIALVLVAGSLTAAAAPTHAADAAAGGSMITPSAPPAELARLNELLAGLAERLEPALVHVSVRRATKPEASDDPHENPHGGAPRSSGSGFVIDPSGLIVTNAHVVENADSVQVRLASGKRHSGTVVGRDNRVDLAVIRIDGATGLSALPLGDSNRVRVGEFVLALGHPFGLERSVSFGIVSRKGDPIRVAAPGFDFIQTDAAINPGNSGGPLVNMAGEVIGVNSMAARNGSIGFAIPASLVRSLVPQLVAKGKIEWGWLGVSIAEITEEEMGRLKLQEQRGVLIRSVIDGEPAAKAGLRPDDVVMAVDGTQVAAPRDLQRVVSATPVGKRIRVALIRDGQEQEVEVIVGLYRDRDAESEKPAKPGKPETPEKKPETPEKKK